MSRIRSLRISAWIKIFQGPPNVGWLGKKKKAEKGSEVEAKNSRGILD